MKIRVLNKSLVCYNREFHVENMTYDVIKIKDDGKVKYLRRKDVKLIPENQYDYMIQNYNDILKIKLNSGINEALYSTLINLIKENINEEITGIEVLKDNFGEIRKRIWEKKLAIIVNNKYPLEILIIGTRFGKRFNITFKNLSILEFITKCENEIKKLQVQIGERENMIERYNKSISKLKCNDRYINGI